MKSGFSSRKTPMLVYTPGKEAAMRHLSIVIVLLSMISCGAPVITPTLTINAPVQLTSSDSPPPAPSPSVPSGSTSGTPIVATLVDYGYQAQGPLPVSDILAYDTLLHPLSYIAISNGSTPGPAMATIEYSNITICTYSTLGPSNTLSIQSCTNGYDYTSSVQLPKDSIITITMPNTTAINLVTKIWQYII